MEFGTVLAVICAAIAISALVVACFAFTDKDEFTTTTSLSSDGPVVADSLYAARDTRTGTLTAYSGVRAYGATEVDLLTVNQGMNIDGNLQVGEVTTTKVTAPLVESGSAAPVVVGPAISTGDVKSTGQVSGASASFGAVQASSVTSTGPVSAPSVAAGTLTANSAAIAGNATVGGQLGVTGLATLQNLLVQGTATYNGSLAIQNLNAETVHATNGLLVDTGGSAQFDVPTSVSAPFVVSGFFTGGTGVFTNLAVSNSFSAASAVLPALTTQNLNTTLLTAQEGTFGTGFPASTALTNEAKSEFKRLVTIGTAQSPGDLSLDVKRNATVGGTLAVTGAASTGAFSAPSATISGTVGAGAVNAGATQTGTFLATSNAQINGTTVLNGTLTANAAVTAATTLNVGGAGSGTVLLVDKDAEVRKKAVVGTNEANPVALSLDSLAGTALRGFTTIHRPVISSYLRTRLAAGGWFNYPSGNLHLIPLDETTPGATLNNLTFAGNPAPPSFGLSLVSSSTYSPKCGFRATSPFGGVYLVNGFIQIFPGSGSFDTFEPIFWTDSDVGLAPSPGASWNFTLTHTVRVDGAGGDLLRFTGFVTMFNNSVQFPFVRVNSASSPSVKESMIEMALLTVI